MICIFSGIICYIFFLIFNIFFRPGQDHLPPAVTAAPMLLWHSPNKQGITARKLLPESLVFKALIKSDSLKKELGFFQRCRSNAS